MTFGSYIKRCRIAKGLTLREACRLSRIDLSDWSKMERDVNTAPRNRDRYLAVTGTLSIDCSAGGPYNKLAWASQETPAPMVVENDIDDHMPLLLKLTPEQEVKLRPLVRESLTRNPLF